MSEAINYIMGREDAETYQLLTHAEGPEGSLPLTGDMLLNLPSGDLFGLSQNVGMGWKPDKLMGWPFGF
jgi:hypothetical protein